MTVGVGAAASHCGFNSKHPGGLNFSYGDGSVSFITDDIDSTSYKALSTRMPEADGYAPVPPAGPR